MRDGDLVFSGFVQTEAPDDVVANLTLVLLPVSRVQPSNFSIAKHLFPITFHSLFPTQLFLLTIMQDLQITPTFLGCRLVLIAKWSEAESRRAFSCISKDRDCIVKVGLIAEYLIFFVETALVFDYLA